MRHPWLVPAISSYFVHGPGMARFQGRELDWAVNSAFTSVTGTLLVDATEATVPPPPRSPRGKGPAWPARSPSSGSRPSATASKRGSALPTAVTEAGRPTDRGGCLTRSGSAGWPAGPRSVPLGTCTPSRQPPSRRRPPSPPKSSPTPARPPSPWASAPPRSRAPSAPPSSAAASRRRSTDHPRRHAEQDRRPTDPGVDRHRVRLGQLLARATRAVSDAYTSRPRPLANSSSRVAPNPPAARPRAPARTARAAPPPRTPGAAPGPSARRAAPGRRAPGPGRRTAPAPALRIHKLGAQVLGPDGRRVHHVRPDIWPAGR